ncbi:hypothetical protein [Streptomyces sp. NPDC048644]|uniref:hypothetical protein n=1 Tax=Streptomyces sp. NPDC048644 TaxID=3365582 RepID=UPI00371778E9
MARSTNPTMVWDGTKWVDGTKHVWDGVAWAGQPPVLVYDGSAWQVKAPVASPYPAFTASSAGVFGMADHVGLPVPAQARILDFVVSVCVATAPPQLISPGGYVAQICRLDSGHFVSIAMWPYDGRLGDVVWRVAGSTTATTINLVYRGGDVSSTPIAPVAEIEQHRAVSRVPLTAPGPSTSLFLVLVESTDLTGYAWPEGILARAQQLGRFGALGFSILAADTPGTGASAGALRLDTTAASAVCLTIRVPGLDDGRPTWVLGDDSASVLGSTTVLG